MVKQQFKHAHGEWRFLQFSLVGVGICRAYGAWNNFLDWFSTNMSPLWSFGTKRPSQKLSATSPRPSPLISLAEREEEAVGSMMVLGHFERFGVMSISGAP